MNPEALVKELGRDPFVPLRLRLSDGQAVEIENPGLSFINNLSLYLVPPGRPHPRSVPEFRLISLRHIVTVETL